MCSEGVSAYLFIYFTLCQQSQYTSKQWILDFSQLEAPESQRSQGLIRNNPIWATEYSFRT